MSRFWSDLSDEMQTALSEEEKTIHYAYWVASIESVPLSAVHVECQDECGYGSELGPEWDGKDFDNLKCEMSKEVGDG